jgi:hypothetical protein
MSLPDKGASMHAVLLPTELRLPLFKENLGSLGIGILETPDISLGDTGIQAKLSASSADPVRCEGALSLSPIDGTLDATQVDSARQAREDATVKDAAHGAVAGAEVGSLLGPAGAALGAMVGAGIGAAVGSDTSESTITFTIANGSLGAPLKLTYNPDLKLTLSVVGLSWLLDTVITLHTNLNLVLAPAISFAGSTVSLKFVGGQLAHTEFDLKPMVAPELGVSFAANGQLEATVNLLPILGQEAPVDGSDAGVELADLVTAPFSILDWSTTIGGEADVNAERGSPFKVKGMNVAPAAGAMGKAFQQWMTSSTKQMPFSKPPATNGPPTTGRTPAEAIPLVWFKPFNRYLDKIALPAAAFGTTGSGMPRAAKRFPHRVYDMPALGSHLELGVDQWPHEGMTLLKKSNQRGSGVGHFKEDLDSHGITLPDGYQIDHVIDLVFEGGVDDNINLWPLAADVNTGAGGKWSNGQSLVTWVNRIGDPPFLAPPSAVPVGRWFVIETITEP